MKSNNMVITITISAMISLCKLSFTSDLMEKNQKFSEMIMTAEQ